MIVALYQCVSPAGDPKAGLDLLRKAMQSAASMGVGMLVMPEVFIPGYASMTPSRQDDLAAVNKEIAAACRAFDMAVTLGLPEIQGDCIFNTAVAFDAAGDILARYRKIQLFGPEEKALYTSGDDYVVFDYLGTRFGLLICYDVEFPEHTRALARMGAEVILVPTANMQPFVNVNQVMVPARAAENAITIVYANYCGSEGHLKYVGHSGIFGPDGHALASAGLVPALCAAELPDGSNGIGLPLSTQIADLRPIKHDG